MLMFLYPVRRTPWKESGERIEYILFILSLIYQKHTTCSGFITKLSTLVPNGTGVDILWQGPNQSSRLWTTLRDHCTPFSGSRVHTDNHCATRPSSRHHSRGLLCQEYPPVSTTPNIFPGLSSLHKTTTRHASGHIDTHRERTRLRSIQAQSEHPAHQLHQVRNHITTRRPRKSTVPTIQVYFQEYQAQPTRTLSGIANTVNEYKDRRGKHKTNDQRGYTSNARTQWQMYEFYYQSKNPWILYQCGPFFWD